MAALPTQQLVVYHTASGPSTVIHSAPLPLPTRPPGYLLVRVRAISVNPKDWKGRKQANPKGIKACLGEDIAGDVVASDPASPYPPGTRIFAMLNMLEWRGDTRFFQSNTSYLPTTAQRPPETTDSDGKIRWGASAEYTIVQERFATPIPASVSYLEAASVPLAALTALQNLQKCGFTGKDSLLGRHVLVHAGAGGVGTWVIQLAKLGGAYVSCTCSPSNFEYVESLGCDRPINYHQESFELIDWERGGPDIVVDLMGGEYELKSLGLLPRRWWRTEGGERPGHYLHVLNSGWQTYFQSSWFKRCMPVVWVGFTAAMLSLSTLQLLGLEYSFTIVCPNSQDLKFIGQLLASGECRAVIDSVLPFSASSMRSAHDKSERGHCRGKIVLAMGAGASGGLCSNL